MTIASLLRASLRSYALVLVIFGVFAAFLYFAIGLFAAAYVGVAYAVMILRDIGYFRRIVALWPITEQILDWRRVEEFATATDVPPTRAA